MNGISELIIRKHLVRKTKVQKAVFREELISELQAAGIEAKEEKCRNFPKSVNVVVGNADEAELIFGAHYDTAPKMFMPNFITPKNPLLYIAYQLLIVGLLLGAALLVSLPARRISDELAYFVFMAAYWGMFLLILMGPANPNTYNDNTSGVVSLIEIMLHMDEETRAKCAFVFFDHEEVGLVGSAAFAKMHKKAAKDTPMINIDCVGDGEHLLLVAKKDFMQDEKAYAALKAAFEDGGSVLHADASKTVYPSDQSSFKKSVGTAALRYRKFIGYYMNRIHTVKDTVLEEKNVERVTAGMTSFALKYLK